MDGLTLVDVSNNGNLKRLNWGKNAPAWWIPCHGLCLEGVCNNSRCEADGQNVLMPIGYAKFNICTQHIFNHIRNSLVSYASMASTMPKCPMCFQYVKPKRFAVNNCWWKFSGFKENNEMWSSDWHYADDAYHRFDDDPATKVVRLGLFLEVVKEKPT